MNRNTLNVILEQLKSDKVRDRQEGLSSLRTAFAHDSVILNVDEKRDGRAWLIIFQALFTAVLSEKAKRGATASGGAAAVRRLSEAAAVVRWLTERSVHMMNKKAIKPLLVHLLQTMVHDGKLFGAVALDYVKTIRCILEWTPHLDHLDDSMWVNILELGFNVVLGDPLRKRLDEDRDQDDSREDSVALGTDIDVSDLVQGDEEEEDIGTPSTSTSNTTRKRRYQSPKQTSLPQASRAASSAPKVSQSKPVSKEQIEFMSIIGTLLRSSSAPLLASNYTYLPAAVMNRFERFVRTYPPDTSLYHDCLQALSATLPDIALNHCTLVSKFAETTWDRLVGLWNTKNQRMKEDLLVVLRTLFPFLTEDQTEDDRLASTRYGFSIAKLWNLLNGEAESRWGTDGLSLDALRLQLIRSDGSEDTSRAFVANTFRYGWHFDPNQALAWAVLELQADCAKKLYLLSESTHTMALKGKKNIGKRIKLENPIASLLYSIRTQATSSIRAYHLQILLFFVDRHWSILHGSLTQDVISTLLQFVSFEDGLIQSWIFLCLAAIAHANSSRSICPPFDTATWDSVWTHAMRRSTVPAVSRAACHAAHVLLFHSTTLLTSQRVFVEIETLAKDLDVQGPAFPYDSVCWFLTLCLRVANQDVRLYRLQLEEKVLTWLMDAWRVDRGRRLRMPLHTSTDVLMLLESICALSRRSKLMCGLLLPQSPIVESLIEEHRTASIRNFLLCASLPPFRETSSMSVDSSLTKDTSYGITASDTKGIRLEVVDVSDLAQPRGRERRISAFLLKSMEEVAAILESGTEHITAEKLRAFLDLSMIVLIFEATLVLNGTQSNRRVVQMACKLAGSIIPLITDQRWTSEERALVVSGLQPLVIASDSDRDHSVWETLLTPNEGTGIRKRILRSLQSVNVSHHQQLCAARRQLQRLVFRSSDVQDAFASLMTSIRNVIRLVLGSRLENDVKRPHDMDVDDKDDFGSVRTTQDVGRLMLSRQKLLNTSLNCATVNICMAALAVIPILQSTSEEPTRDRELADLVLNCETEQFLIIAPAYFNNVRQRTLNLSLANLDRFLDKLESLLKQYAYARSERMQLVAIHFLHSTVDLWTQKAVVSVDVGDHIRSLCHWLLNILRTNKIRSWKIRDHVIRFFDDYLVRDPAQEVWSTQSDSESQSDEESGPDSFPMAVLPRLGADEDIRVRFRAAVTNARLFSIARVLRCNTSDLYQDVKNYLCKDLNNYEHMLTRLLCLGNIMIMSSAVRRGPYWHLLEACLYTSVYSRHVEAVLTCVAERLGLSKFSQLFEAYASQIAFSIRQGGLDFLCFQPHLLGFRDRRECAEATFHAFTPTNLLAGGTHSSVAHGHTLFVNHCKAIQKSTADGLRECFAEIVGYQIVFWVDDHQNSTDSRPDDLEELLRTKTKDMDGEKDFSYYLTRSADAIIVAILRTLGDQDWSPNGPIVQALRLLKYADIAVQTFQRMSCYRSEDRFETHPPNLPAYNTVTVLRALRWFKMRVPDAETPAITYHVLHQLFAILERSSIVNEQIRLINAICLWISTHSGHFEDYTLLRTVINGATTILMQPDLARAAQSVLDWGLDMYRKCTEKDTRLPDVLIRLSCLCYDYSLDLQDSSFPKMGHDLLMWLGNCVSELCKNKTLRPNVVKALAAWPQDLPSNLRTLCEDVKGSGLSAILGDHRISSSKFRMVGRLRDLTLNRRQTDGHFAKSDFWRLKDCIPPATQLLDGDIDAFNSLLLLNTGNIDSFGNEQSQGVRTYHRNGVRRGEQIEGHDAAHHAIVISLLRMLDAASAEQVHISYLTLRSLMSVYNTDSLPSRSWPSEFHGELLYMQAHPTTLARCSECSLDHALVSENSLEMTRNFTQWIPYITVLLCRTLATTDLFFAPLVPILQSDVTFAEQMLPVLVHTMLHAKRSASDPHNNNFFRDILSSYFSSILASEFADISCLRAIVDIVLHLRFFRPCGTKDALAHDKWLNIDFTLLSQKAIKCGAYTTGLLFLELAAEYSDGTSLDTATTESILFDIYRHIDEPDGFYGIKTHDLHRFLIRRLHHEKQWDKAFRFHGAALEACATDPIGAEGMVQALHSFGFDHLAMKTVVQTAAGIDTDRTSNSMTYQLGWRTETWDLPENLEEHNSGASLYLALRAIYRERSEEALDVTIRNATVEELKQLRSTGDESLTDIRQMSRNLMCLHQVRQWRGSLIQTLLRSKCIDVDKWTIFTQIDPNFDFSDLEAIMATRIALIRSARQREQREQIGSLLSPFCRGLIDLEVKCLVCLSEAARHADHPQVALNSICRARELDPASSSEVRLEFANVLWQLKEPKLAVESLADVLATVQTEIPTGDASQKIKHALLLARLGTWTAEASLGKPADILIRCFDPATNLLQSDGQGLKGCDSRYAMVYHQYAIFAERQYHSSVNSPDALRWRVYVDRKIEEIKQRHVQIQKALQGTKEWEDLVREQRRAEKLLNQDKAQFKDHIRTRESFLSVAIDMYSRCLAASDTFDDDSHIRLCSLWMANFDTSSPKLALSVALDRVPSHKFVFLAHQLTARLSKPKSSQLSLNQQCLQTLITRMCREHPFHSLFQVYCLVSERATAQPSSAVRRQSGRLEPISAQADRVTAAGDLFDRLRSDTSFQQRIQDIEYVCNASLQWAKYPIKGRSGKTPKGPLQIPDDLLIRTMRNVNVPVITVQTPVDQTTQYHNCVWIAYYEASYTLAGGLNLPKINKCFGSDGQKYKQLFKGEGDDDLRQDAVMEQVFELVNIVLRRDRKTKKRNLSVKGYKVVPLASQAGVIEWVENTTPLSHWLPAAHVRHRPGDMPEVDVRAQLAQKHKECNHEVGPLLKLFVQIRERFQPVMRHYFTEKHKTPMSWFTMRLKYARSVATTSIVGHILGLGDRHTSNILIDNGTGEVVHIDLGIAFDQGKLLPVPERVPFRLTADMVDGFGISGTQGVFQRCAEETLRVLRDRSEIILTILEVFKYDPLHSWAASELKVKRVQGSSNETAQLTGEAFRYAIGIDMASGTADEAAERALSAVRRKLDITMTVEYTVNELIAEATDLGNLATMFHGWTPYY
ncbi:hypothetical protein AcV7_007443 [Taiwanofungus camphoratus]|nr:hypothetical protein AcV7_007443 [Antrodia cinnamomea]